MPIKRQSTKTKAEKKKAETKVSETGATQEFLDSVVGETLQESDIVIKKPKYQKAKEQRETNEIETKQNIEEELTNNETVQNEDTTASQDVKQGEKQTDTDILDVDTIKELGNVDKEPDTNMSLDSKEQNFTVSLETKTDQVNDDIEQYTAKLDQPKTFPTRLVHSYLGWRND